MQIEKMMVVSTSHLDEETVKTLNEAAEDYPPFCDLEWGPTFARDEGWVFHVRPLAANGQPDESEGTPTALSGVFAFARQHACEWVMFDCDGDVIETLTTWEW